MPASQPPRRRTSRPSARLIPHDVTIERRHDDRGVPEVVATIYCERRDCRLPVEVCVRCERFARIEPHEAGYTMLCRSKDVEVDESPSIVPQRRVAVEEE